MKIMSRLLKIAECVLLVMLFSCTEDRLVPAGFLYLNVEEDATLITKAQSEVTFESLRVDILDMDGDTVKTYPLVLTMMGRLLGMHLCFKEQKRSWSSKGR